MNEENEIRPLYRFEFDSVSINGIEISKRYFKHNPETKGVDFVPGFIERFMKVPGDPKLRISITFKIDQAYFKEEFQKDY